jgi:hypothetical protein
MERYLKAFALLCGPSRLCAFAVRCFFIDAIALISPRLLQEHALQFRGQARRLRDPFRRQQQVA